VAESVCQHFSVEVYNQYRGLVQQVYETENARHEGVCREPFACLRESCVHCIDQLNFPEQERVERITRLLVQQWDMNETSMTEMQRRIHGHFAEPQYAGKHLYARYEESIKSAIYDVYFKDTHILEHDKVWRILQMEMESCNMYTVTMRQIREHFRQHFANPRYQHLDLYNRYAASIKTGVRHIVAGGGRPARASVVVI